MTTVEMELLEKEVQELKEKLTALEEKVRALTQPSEPVAPPTPKQGETLTRAEIIAWLKARGRVAELTPEEKKLAAKWDTLPEEEKEEHIRYMRSLRLDPPLSQIIIDNRR